MTLQKGGILSEPYGVVTILLITVTSSPHIFLPVVHVCTEVMAKALFDLKSRISRIPYCGYQYTDLKLRHSIISLVMP